MCMMANRLPAYLQSVWKWYPSENKLRIPIRHLKEISIALKLFLSFVWNTREILFHWVSKEEVSSKEIIFLCSMGIVKGITFTEFLLSFTSLYFQLEMYFNPDCSACSEFKSVFIDESKSIVASLYYTYIYLERNLTYFVYIIPPKRKKN